MRRPQPPPSAKIRVQ